MQPIKRKPGKTASCRVSDSVKADSQELHISIKPGTRKVLSIEAGREGQGEIPVHIRVGREQNFRDSESPAAGKAARSWLKPFSGLAKKIRRSAFLKRQDLASWLFWASLALCILTRLIGWTKFPIYFFVDEALPTQFAADLVENGFRGYEDALFPPAFQNGTSFTLGMGGYAQLLPYLILGKSSFIPRATSAWNFGCNPAANYCHPFISGYNEKREAR